MQLRQEGITLIELLIGVVILGILAGFIYSLFNKKAVLNCYEDETVIIVEDTGDQLCVPMDNIYR